MRKIPSVFKRDYEGTRLVYPEVVPGTEWVLEGAGRATRKWDGTACLVKDGVLYRRYDIKRGRTPPPSFLPAQDEPDPETGHWPCWVPVDAVNPNDQWHWAAWQGGRGVPDGTYELLGPKVQGNPEGMEGHCLVRHGEAGIGGDPRTFDEIKAFLETAGIEGIVWHHPDGRMAKIKARDFGIPWPPK